MQHQLIEVSKLVKSPQNARRTVARGAAEDLKDVIESVDINPFIALPQGQGGMALDALIVLRRR